MRGSPMAHLPSRLPREQLQRIGERDEMLISSMYILETRYHCPTMRVFATLPLREPEQDTPHWG